MIYQRNPEGLRPIEPLLVSLKDGRTVQVRDLLAGLMPNTYLLTTAHELIHISQAQSVAAVPDDTTDQKRRALRLRIQTFIDQIPEG